MAINVGDTVKLTTKAKRLWSCPDDREDNSTAIVKALLPDIEGGLFMDRDLRGCRYWNETDVMVTKQADLTNKK